MKSFLSIIIVFFSIAAQAALPTDFPKWLTDEKAKLWAVDHLIEFMKDDKYYKIQSIKINRQFDETNKCDSMEIALEFDDPSCKGRQVVLSVLAPLCSDQGCNLIAGMTDCIPGTSSTVKIQKFISR